MELKHSNSGYIWIEGGTHVQQFTDKNHVFTIKNHLKEEVFSLKLYPYIKEEL